MKITKEQIEKASKSEYQSIDQSQLGAMIMKYEREAFTKGAKWAISQMQPEWVSVEDANPEPKQHYFAMCKSPSGKLFKCVVVYTEGWCLEVECDGDEDYLNHDEIKERSYMPKGWYEQCEQQGGFYDNMYFKREVAFILTNIDLPQPPTK